MRRGPSSISILCTALLMGLGACQKDSGAEDGSVASDTTSDGEAEGESESSDSGGSGERQPFVDDWEIVGAGPAADIELLSVGDRLTSDNFANRGDIEVLYVEGIDEITIEMQRFTVASMAQFEGAFERMQPWLYDLAIPESPGNLSPDDACWAPGTTGCYVRAYYEGLFQPLRDGANFRVTIPAGWDGELELVTSDNLEEGIDTYPDRSDILVDGLAGMLSVDLDSGNVAVRLDPNIAHYAGCANNDECVMQGHAMGCGCVEPTTIAIANATGQASNISVDVGNVEHWYTVLLENRADFMAGDPICEASIDCSAFADCALDPAYVALLSQERAEINYPGDPAIIGAGIRIALVSESCAAVNYVTGPEDYGNPELPAETRGYLEVCAGCL